MIRKLRWKFVLAMTSCSMIILMIVFCSSFLSTKAAIQRESEENLMRIFEMNKIQNTFYFPSFKSDMIRTPFFIITVSKDGMITEINSNYFGLNDNLDMEWLISIAKTSLESSDNVGIIKEESLRFCKKYQFDCWKIAFIDTSFEENSIYNLLQNMILIALGSAVGIFLLSVALANWITKPVEKAWNQQRQFVADASHELKTPLTVIISNSDMLLSESFLDNQNQRRLENIHEESIRMKGLVEDMLYLARSDANSANKSFEVLSFSDILMDSVLMFEPLAFEKGKFLDYEIAEDIFVLGNSNSLRQLIQIFLDNALKYSYKNSQIKVVLKQNSAKTVCMTVSNKGDLLSAEDCKRIFERFYRTDPARKNNGGYGLGLSIAVSLVKEMNGKLWAESFNEENHFFIQLPTTKCN